MEYFLEQIKLILPVVNFMSLVPSVVTRNAEKESESFGWSEVYQIKTKKLDAQMIETDKGYVVLSGSECSKQTSSSISEGWVKLRNKLIETGVLLDTGGNYTFKENAIFSSISAAAAIVLGRQAAGPVEWIDKHGKTYKQNQENQFEGDFGDDN